MGGSSGIAVVQLSVCCLCDHELDIAHTISAVFEPQLDDALVGQASGRVHAKDVEDSVRRQRICVLHYCAKSETKPSYQSVKIEDRRFGGS